MMWISADERSFLFKNIIFLKGWLFFSPGGFFFFPFWGFFFPV
jgi:hypothetical protein